jgi:hypothetical protein
MMKVDMHHPNSRQLEHGTNLSCWYWVQHKKHNKITMNWVDQYAWKRIFKPLGKGLPIEIRVRHVLLTISLCSPQGPSVLLAFYPMVQS